MNVPLRTLEDVAVLVGGGTPSRAKSEYFGGDVPWVTPTDLPPIGTVRLLGSVAENITEAGLRNSSATLVPPGTVLFSSRASIGKIAVVNRECSTNQGFCNFVPRHGVVDPWYLAYYLCSATDNIVELAGKTTFKEVSRKKLRSFCIPVPTLGKQRRIVHRINECVERIDEIRQLRNEGIGESKAIESAFFQDFLHDGVGVPRWPLDRLGELTKSSRYGTSVRARLEQVGTPVLRMGNILDGYLDFSNLKYVDLPAGEKRKYLLCPGDILINRTNSLELVGKAATFDGRDGDWVYASYLVRIQVDTKQILPEFVTATINSRIGREYVLRTARRAIGMVNINAKEMAGFPISLPPLDVQRELVERLAEVRRISHQIRSGLGAGDADHLSSAVLRKAFTGEL